jgi:hypothetical protein
MDPSQVPMMNFATRSTTRSMRGMRRAAHAGIQTGASPSRGAVTCQSHSQRRGARSPRLPEETRNLSGQLGSARAPGPDLRVPTQKKMTGRP